MKPRQKVVEEPETTQSNLKMPKALWTELKVHAARSHRSLGAVVQQAIEELLEREA
jgi:hypothetical protein